MIREMRMEPAVLFSMDVFMAVSLLCVCVFIDATQEGGEEAVRERERERERERDCALRSLEDTSSPDQQGWDRPRRRGAGAMHLVVVLRGSTGRLQLRINHVRRRCGFRHVPRMDVFSASWFFFKALDAKYDRADREKGKERGKKVFFKRFRLFAHSLAHSLTLSVLLFDTCIYICFSLSFLWEKKPSQSTHRPRIANGSAERQYTLAMAGRQGGGGGRGRGGRGRGRSSGGNRHGGRGNRSDVREEDVFIDLFNGM